MKLHKTILLFVSFLAFSLVVYASCKNCDCDLPVELRKNCSPTCTCKSESPTTSSKTTKVAISAINSDVLNTLINSGIPMVILDARTGKFDDGRRIPGAKSLNENSSPEEVARIIPDKKTLIVTYCSNLKCPASYRLSLHLKKLGYTNILKLPEGIDGWIKAGFSVESAK